MKLKVVSLQKLNGSYFVYLPKSYAKEHFKKGQKLEWTVDEGNHNILHLKKAKEGKI